MSMAVDEAISQLRNMELDRENIEELVRRIERGELFKSDAELRRMAVEWIEGHGVFVLDDMADDVREQFTCTYAEAERVCELIEGATVQIRLADGGAA